MSKRSDAEKAIERLPRPERIRFAKAKMKKVIDHFLFVIELHNRRTPLLLGERHGVLD